MTDIIIVHREDWVAFYANGELLFYTEKIDLIESITELQYRNINTITHKYLSSKGFERCDSGEYPERLSDFESDDFES